MHLPNTVSSPQTARILDNSTLISQLSALIMNFHRNMFIDCFSMTVLIIKKMEMMLHNWLLIEITLWRSQTHHTKSESTAQTLLNIILKPRALANFNSFFSLFPLLLLSSRAFRIQSNAATLLAHLQPPSNSLQKSSLILRNNLSLLFASSIIATQSQKKKPKKNKSEKPKKSRSTPPPYTSISNQPLEVLHRSSYTSSPRKSAHLLT